MISISGFRIVQKVYESAGSLVFRGHRVADESQVILKVLKNDYPTPAELTRYRQEFEITRGLDIEGVIGAHDLIKYHNTLVMVLDDFGGESLKLMSQKRNFTVEEVLRLGIRIAEILAGVHDRDIVHKDINPSNIVYNRELNQLQLIDFGIATRLARSNPEMSNPEVMEGTLSYMSPEQTGRMNRFVDYRTDFYSLGATLYDLLCNEPPFTSSDPMEIVHAHLARKVVPPMENNPEVQPDLSSVIMKLLAKTADERYRSGWGIAADLQTCLEHYLNGYSGSFEPGSQDICDRFRVSQRLYGRKEQIKTLLETFENVAQEGSGLMLISGYSGIGKSSLVKEIHKPVTRLRGNFVTGKFDQYQRIPYSAINMAFRELVHRILTEHETRLANWRRKIEGALGKNARLMIEVIPELAHVIGQGAPVVELGAFETAHRFRMVYLNFVRCLCAAEHPLVLFLDDLQWADLPSLELMSQIIMDRGTNHLFIIGAYRDNEVGPAHNLTRTVEELRRNELEVPNIKLGPLEQEHVAALIAETLAHDEKDVQELARLVFNKTGGNPFFVNQFLKALYEKELVAFVREGKRGFWRWDLPGINNMGFTDNVVELVLDKMKRLPQHTREMLALASCVGTAFSLDFLADLEELDERDSYRDLMPAIEEGLILTTSEPEVIEETLVVRHFTFLHDRVQQAAYALIAEQDRAKLHFNMARLLLKRLDSNEREKRLFEIVDHFNQAACVVENPDDHLEMAQLNLTAGRRARNATALEPAANYLDMGIQVMNTAFADSAWQEHYDISLALHVDLAEVAFLKGDFPKSEEVTGVALAHVKTPLERVAILTQLVTQYTMIARYKEAIEMGINALGLIDIQLSLEDPMTPFQEDLVVIQQQFHGQKISKLVDTPEAQDPTIRTALELLASLQTAAYTSLRQYFPMIVARQVRLSLEHGVVSASALGFGSLGLIFCAQMQQFELGYQLGKLGYVLSTRFNDPVSRGRSCVLLSGFLIPWNRHLRRSEEIAEEGLRVSLECGAVQWAGYCASLKAFSMIMMGRNLDMLLDECDEFLAFSNRTGNKHIVNLIRLYRMVALNLRGESRCSTSFDIPDITEDALIAEFEKENDNHSLFLYAVFKMRLLYLHGHLEEARKQARETEKLLPHMSGTFQAADYFFYFSLIMTACYRVVNAKKRQEYDEKLNANLEKLMGWASHCPENFSHRVLLIEAEIARIKGKMEKATRLYDQALDEAESRGFPHERALADELAGKCWLQADRPRIARVYLRDALHAYRVWGASALASNLETRQARVLGAVSRSSGEPGGTFPGGTHTGKELLEEMDMASVIKATQAISGEIVLSRLLDRIMHILAENAGAQQGLLLLESRDQWQVRARLELGVDEVYISEQPLSRCPHVSSAIVNYVVKTHESVVLDDAVNQGMFVSDPYILKRKPKSILCLPILHHGNLLSVLYLENNLATHAFTTRHLRMLKLLSTQAAVSMENARLYTNMERLVEARTEKLRDTLAQLQQQHSQLKQTKKQLVQSEKMASLGTLTAGIAHELKNPLNFINNFAHVSVELVEEMKEEFDRLKAGSDLLNELMEEMTINSTSIHRHGVQADRIVKSMMNMAGGGSNQKEIVSFNDHLDEYVQLARFGARLQKSGLNLEAEKAYDENVGSMPIVAQNLGRVWINLINNSVDALMEKRERLGTDFEPQLFVSTSSVDDSVIIRIRDNGSGIPEEKIGKIFDPFYTSKAPGEGVGLGLAICYDIVVSEHGGKMEVKSEHEVFTEFTITLPRMADQSSS